MKTEELNSVQSEFQLYKQRAHALLDQQQDRNYQEEKIKALESNLYKLKSENGELKRINLDLNARLKELEKLSNQLMEQSQTFEKEIILSKDEKSAAEAKYLELEMEIEKLNLKLESSKVYKIV